MDSLCCFSQVLDEAVRSGRIKGGETLAFAGFGAGLTWASAIAKWQH